MTIAATIGRRAAELESASRVGEFVHIARVLCASRGDLPQALSLARAGRATDRVIEVLKSAVSAGSTTDTTWAAALAEYRAVAGGFLESLVSASAFDRMLGDMVVLPMHTRVAATTVAAVSATVAERSAKPISRLTLAAGDLTERKAVCMIAISVELMRLGGAPATGLLRRELVAGVTAATDSQFISVLTSGLTAIPSSGPTALATRWDLRALLAAVDLGAASRPYLLMGAAVAKELSAMGDSAGAAAFPGMTPLGGTLIGVPVVVSDGVAAGVIVLVDAAAIIAASETVVLSASTQADIAMDTSPDSPPSASTILTPMWQNDLVALKAERLFAVLRPRADSVAMLSNASYVGNSPS